MRGQPTHNKEANELAATNVLHPDTKSVRLDDGRVIVYCQFGDPHGGPVFYFHGTPGSRLEPALTHEACVEHAIRLFAPDRPGVGGSSYIRNRGLLDWPQDVMRIADYLRIDRFGAAQLPGGGSLLHDEYHGSGIRGA